MRDIGGTSFDRDNENIILASEAQYEDVVDRHHTLMLGYIKLRTVTVDSTTYIYGLGR